MEDVLIDSDGEDRIGAAPNCSCYYTPTGSAAAGLDLDIRRTKGLLLQVFAPLACVLPNYYLRPSANSTHTALLKRPQATTQTKAG
jgi:hypothetical protein